MCIRSPNQIRSQPHGSDILLSFFFWLKQITEISNKKRLCRWRFGEFIITALFVYRKNESWTLPKIERRTSNVHKHAHIRFRFTVSVNINNHTSKSIDYVKWVATKYEQRMFVVWNNNLFVFLLFNLNWILLHIHLALSFEGFLSFSLTFQYSS